jgi:heme/copper-type cytochrome/quinol oxidase subunit 4
MKGFILSYYLRYIKILRYVFIFFVWIIQILTLLFFLEQTNNGNNDPESDAVLLLFSLIVLIFTVLGFIYISFLLEKKTLWKIIHSFTIILIPVIWIIIIYYFGNPLYKYYK